MRKNTFFAGLLVASFWVLICSCSVKIPVDVASGVIFASDNIDTMQASVGKHSTSKQAMVDLDELQLDIERAISTVNVSDIDSYHQRAVVIYSTLKAEVTARRSELSKEQLNSLIALDSELIALNSAVLKLKAVKPSAEKLLEFVYRASILMAYHKGLL